jgi:hypothetical protein
VWFVGEKRERVVVVMMIAVVEVLVEFCNAVHC